MIPYYILIFTPLIPLLLNKNHRQKKINTLSIDIFFLILFLLMALRDVSIGRDLSSYAHYFSLFSEMEWGQVFSSDIEPGYIILNKIVALFTKDFQWMIVVTSALTVFPVWRLYRKNIEYPYLSIVLYLILPTFVMFFSGLRQSIAISLGIIAYVMAKEKKIFKFILIVALAALFHRSAFILLAIYPVYNLKITKKWLLLVVPAMIAVFIFNKPIFVFLESLISEIYSGNVQSTGAYTMLILFALFGLYSYVIPDEKEMSAEETGLRNLLLLSILIQMFAPLHSLAMRMNYYFIIFIPLLIPKIIKKTSLRYRQVASLSHYVMLFYFLIYFFINIPSGNILDTFQYRFFWEIVK